MIHSLNHLGANFTDFALPMLVQSSLLIVLLFLLDHVLRHRVRAVVRYGLWMLVLIKLVLPPSFAAPTSLAYWLSEKKAVKTPPAPSQQFVVRYSDVKFDETRPLPSPPPPRAKLQFAGWLLLGWLATALGLMAWLVRRSRSVVRTAARALPASESPEQLLDACRRQMGIKRRVRLKLSATPCSPAVFGLWRPVILIPQKLTDKLSSLQLRAVLFHELAHIKRSDALVHYLQTLLQIIYWWHPLLWLANAQIRRVREQAVDEAVVVAMGSDAEAYLATLLEVAKLVFNRPTFALGLIGIVESKSALAQRVQHLLNRPIPKSARLGFTGLAALFLAGAAFLPMARGQRTPNQPQQVASESGQQQPVVAMDVRFIEIEESHLGTVGLGEPTLTEFNGHRAWVLTPDELNGVLQRIQEQTATDILTASRVTTFSGQQSQIQILDAVPAYGTEIRVGPICDLIPYVSGELVDLAVVASVTEPRPVDPTAPFTSVAEAFLTNEVGTVRVIVGNGGGVVLENPEAKSSKGNRYLVIVSATVVSANRAAESQTLNQASTAATGAATRKQEAPKASFQNATRTPPTNSPKSQTSSTVTSSERQEDDASVGESGQLTVTVARLEPYFLPLFGPAREAIEAKLKQIILPDVIFDNVPLPEALRWLTEQARKHDPDGTGLNFLLNPNVIPAGPEAIIDPTTGQPVTHSSPQPLDMNTVMVRINPPLKNVQLSDALEAIVHTADKPIRYSIEDYAVIFSQNQPGTAHLETRTFHVDPKAFIQRLQNKFPGPTDAQQIRGFLTAIGVDVLPPNMVFFNDRRGTLMLRATSEELRRVQDAIDDLGGGGSKETGQGFPTGSHRATVMSAATLEPRNSPGAEAGKSSEAETDLLARMRTYVCDELASLRLRVKLEADGTYLASSEEDGVRPTETGTWKRKGREFILERKAGDLQYAIRRLRVDERNPRQLLWVPELSSVPVGAIDDFVFKPADEAAAASSLSEQTGTKAPSVLETNPDEDLGKPSSSNAALSNSVPALGDLPFVGRLFRSQSALASPGRKAIQAKLNRIVLPELGFDNVRLLEAIQWLAKEASDRDPDGTGVNFLFHPNVIGAAQWPMIDPNTGQVLSPPPPQPLDVNTVTVRINPSLKNVRLGDAVEAVVNGADKPIRYTIAEYAVIFSEKPPNTQGLETRIFRLDPKTFLEDAHRFLLDAGLSDIDIFGHANDWKASITLKFLESLGVSRAPPNTIFYSEGKGWLMVRATAEELGRVQKAVEKLNALRQKATSSPSPSASLNVGKAKASQPNVTKELVVAITAQHIYLGLQPVTLETLKTALAETRGQNPKLNLIIKADRDAPVEQVAAVLETARTLKIEPKSSEMIKLETRVFRVSTVTLLEGLKNTSGLSPNAGTIDSTQDSIRKSFTAAGLNVQPPNALFYNDRTGVLMVRATAEEMDVVEKVLEALNYRPPQITLEARFVEMPTETAGELGLDLPPPDDRTSNTWTRILTAGQSRAVLHAAERHAGVDILSVPKITTLSGRQAQIQAVEIKTIVNGIAPKALERPGVLSTNSNPAQPYLTSQIPCGPTLDVTPHVAADGYTIHLAALPQVTEFIRYDTTLGSPNEARVWLDGKQRNVPRPLPVIRTRQMQATLDVYDGQTLVLGSPRVTQVLQQSNGQSATNAIPEDLGNRLLVFITPTIIDPAGNPIHMPGKEPFPADKPSPQPAR